MKVWELIELLQEVDPSLDVIQTMCSDFSPVDESDFNVIEVLHQGPNHYTRYYPHQHRKTPTNVIQVLHIRGN